MGQSKATTPRGAGRRCRAITKDFRFCKRRGEWKLLCHEHRSRKYLISLFVAVALLLGVVGSIASIHSGWFSSAPAGSITPAGVTPTNGNNEPKQETSDPGKLVVLIADFQGPSPQEYGVTQIIYDQLEMALNKYADTQLIRLYEYIGTREEARAKGKEHHAFIVLWGTYIANEKSVRLTVNFDIPEGGRGLEKYLQKEIIKGSVADLEHFSIQEKMSSKMSCLTLLTIGLVHDQADDFEGAVAIFTDILNQRPQYLKTGCIDYAFFLRGSAQLGLNRYSESINDYSQFIKFHPADYIGYYNRGVAKLQADNTKEALEDFDHAIKLKSDDAQSYHGRGLVLLNSGEPDRAIAEFDKSISLAPASVYTALPYTGRAIAYMQKGNYDQAISDYDQAIKLMPDDAYAYNNRCYVNVEKGNYDQAISDCDQAIKYAPELAAAYNNRGNAYKSKGQFDRAISDYSRALELKSDYAEAYDNRALAYKQKGELDTAIKNFEQAIKINPKLHYAYKELGDVYYIMRDYDRAIANYSKAIEVWPEYVDAYIWRGHAYEMKGDWRKVYDNAIKMLEVNKKNLYRITDPGERERRRKQIDELTDFFKKQLAMMN